MWGAPLLILLIGTGIYLTIKLRFLQIIRLPLALKSIFYKEDKNPNTKGDILKFGSLYTVLSATIATGNVVEVVTTIKSGALGLFFDVGCSILWNGNKICRRDYSYKI